MVINPADPLVDLSLHRNLYLETMAVHLPALMALRQTRQGMSCFKAEFLGQAGAHRPRTQSRRSRLVDQSSFPPGALSLIPPVG